ncbi:unnamed protein product [Cladocopium goreaui]|uniref:Uncharacterized protein n=1 Tax=Cladocopium goreaui TaxID=2562237 RepID=A0A9P1DKQ8_9DINO|nr:unnamed protein product [Cladocopium goreaui]|mmetsp:Transcript_72462/g.160067  ORF Transcript_72462/g.160067 Transcript_72462/m.160067 type:complete len:129 (-) Transcript_72462:125-511(-)
MARRSSSASRRSETTMLPASTQAGFAGLATVETRAPHIFRGIHVERRQERVLGCCRCVSANCDNRPFQAGQFRADPEMLCRRCKMKPAPANIYSPEVMAALRSRGGPIWTRLLKGELQSRRAQAVLPE